MPKYIKKTELQKNDDKIESVFKDHIKYCSLQEFITSLSKIRYETNKLLENFDYSKKSVIAVILGIIDSCSFRIGKDEYFQKNKSTGISTLKKKNITFLIDKIIISFLGKKQVKNTCILYETEIINIIKDLYKSGGEFIFQYQNKGTLKKITYMDVNDFLKKYGDFTTKYYRTVKANVLFIFYLNSKPIPKNKKELNALYREAIKFTAKRLYHTTHICKKNYLDANILSLYKENTHHFYELLNSNIEEYQRDSYRNLTYEEIIYLKFISNYCSKLIN